MKSFSHLAVASALLALAPSAHADLTAYSQDFESLVISDPAALGNAGFLAFANVFGPTGNYLYGYGAFPAPNGTPAFSAIASGLGGAPQGTQYLSVYSDYNNSDHGNGNYIDALVFREQIVGVANVGQTWRMAFDGLQNPVVTNGPGDTTTFAFAKVLMSSNGSFATIAQSEFETTGLSTSTWTSASLDLVITPNMVGELLQFGFRSYATNYNDSSRLYDNLTFDLIGGGGGPSLMPYSEDFEALVATDPGALGAAGFVGFANVFDPLGNRLYGYGTFPAPNGGAGFSAIATGSGGPFQMSQYINIYSDYNNADHGNGNYIEALVFQEQPIGMTNVGETWRFSFDYRQTSTITNGPGDTTTFAFVKVLMISNSSFVTLAEVEFETTGASRDAWASMALDLMIDPSYVGELVQFGYRSYATNYNDSGRFYDNLAFNRVANPGLGSVICLGNPNSTGMDALLTVTGSDVAVDNDLTLTVTGLPANEMGFFVQSPANLLIYNPGNSDGHLCIASVQIGRFSANVLSSGAMGTVTFDPDLTALPTPNSTVPVLAGETRYFQYWTRDMVNGMATSNFSSASGVTFR